LEKGRSAGVTEQQPEPTPTYFKSGWLEKKGKKRFVVLLDNTVYWFEKEQVCFCVFILISVFIIIYFILFLCLLLLLFLFLFLFLFYFYFIF